MMSLDQLRSREFFSQENFVDEMDEVEDMQAFAKDKSKQFQDKLLVEKKRLQKQDLNK
jgi:hypothetical protein